MTQNQSQLEIAKRGDKLISSLERKVLLEYKARQAQVLSVVEKNYLKYLTGIDKADYWDMLNSYNRLTAMNKEIKAIYIGLNKNVTKDILKGQGAIFDNSYYMSQYSTTFFSDTIGKAIKFQAPNPLIRELSITGDLDIMKGIRDKAFKREAEGFVSKAGVTLTSLLKDGNEKSLGDIFKTVKQGLINGESYQKQAKRIKKVVGGNAYNASRIVRTEGNRNLNAGSYANSQDIANQGIEFDRIWVASLDDRTRSTHQQLDGQKADSNGLFHLNGMSAKYPSDWDDPAETINCRCTVIEQLKSVDPLARRGVDPLTGNKEIFSYRTYEDWLKKGAK